MKRKGKREGQILKAGAEETDREKQGLWKEGDKQARVNKAGTLERMSPLKANDAAENKNTYEV